jgi:hypothetical protein
VCCQWGAHVSCPSIMKSTLAWVDNVIEEYALFSEWKKNFSCSSSWSSWSNGRLSVQMYMLSLTTICHALVINHLFVGIPASTLEGESSSGILSLHVHRSTHLREELWYLMEETITHTHTPTPQRRGTDVTSPYSTYFSHSQSHQPLATHWCWLDVLKPWFSQQSGGSRHLGGQQGNPSALSKLSFSEIIVKLIFKWLFLVDQPERQYYTTRLEC